MAKESPLVKVVQLKGKEQTPETLEINLAELIDVKGMKAMGNRLSQFPVKSVELIADSESVDEPIETEEPETDLDEETDSNEPVDLLPDEEPEQAEQVKEIAQPKAEPQKTPIPPAVPKQEVKETPAKEPEPSEDPPKEVHKKVDFEITNPDDIQLDDKGQLGLF
jgi:topoisomerase-4 subunit A